MRHGRLFDSIRTYQEFSYVEWPSEADFATLEDARVGLLAVYAAIRWRLKPTIHFMTNEAIDFAREDGTLYHTLNEGPETFHKEVKAGASCSMKSIRQAQTGDNSCQHVINIQSKKRVLRREGYAPPEFQLQSPSFLPLQPATNIPPLKYAAPLIVRV